MHGLPKNYLRFGNRYFGGRSKLLDAWVCEKIFRCCVHSSKSIGDQKWQSPFLGENSHVEEIILKKVKNNKMRSFVQFSYLVLNYVPFILKMVLFIHLYCQQKFYTNIYVKMKFCIWNFAICFFKKLVWALGCYHKVTSFCWIFAELTFLLICY